VRRQAKRDAAMVSAALATLHFDCISNPSRAPIDLGHLLRVLAAAGVPPASGQVKINFMFSIMKPITTLGGQSSFAKY
jgi:hypothetical protein